MGKNIEPFRVCPNESVEQVLVCLFFFLPMLMFKWSFLPIFSMDLDSVLCARSIGLEYILRNHLKVEKETKVSLQNAILNVVTVTLIF